MKIAQGIATTMLLGCSIAVELVSQEAFEEESSYEWQIQGGEQTIEAISKYDPDNEFGFEGALKHCTGNGKPQKVCEVLYDNFIAFK